MNEDTLTVELEIDDPWDIHCALDDKWTQLPEGDPYRRQLLGLSNRLRNLIEWGGG